MPNVTTVIKVCPNFFENTTSSSAAQVSAQLGTWKFCGLFTNPQKYERITVSLYSVPGSLCVLITL